MYYATTEATNKATIHATSMVVGRLFSSSYAQDPNSEQTTGLLNAYIALRQSLPVVGVDSEGNNLHEGYREARPQTQQGGFYSAESKIARERRTAIEEMVAF
jgi:hypothetical protein|tara:strand:- start:171 stop:476 length:306 start_codon:yes stop_codon:yes gene_type:complete